MMLCRGEGCRCLIMPFQDNAISALDSVLSFMVFIITVLVFVVAQQSSVGTTLAGAGTVLISLSFVFAVRLKNAPLAPARVLTGF